MTVLKQGPGGAFRPPTTSSGNELPASATASRTVHVEGECLVGGVDNAATVKGANIDDIKTYLEERDGLARKTSPELNGSNWSTWFRFVLANGSEFTQHAPPNTRYLPWVRKPNQCYANCIQLAYIRSEQPEPGRLFYAEGYAVMADTGLVLDHAWCVDAAGRIYDPTWVTNVKVGDAYFGVPFMPSYTRERYLRQAENGFVGSFFETGDDGFALLKGPVHGAVEMSFGQGAAR